jgi:formate-dependent nitrite reductase cytochrome c552 subunit
LAYESSPHAKTWRAELDGTAPKNSGVSCATCHMPRISYDVNDWVTRIMVDHNQSANLSPNSKMARSVCMHCHGLDFALKALADPEQIKTNFATSPAQEEHPSMQLARRDKERALRETSGNQ